MKYFKGKISHGFISLYTGRMVLRISSGLLGLFMPIFLYELFDFNIKFVIYYYLAGHILYMFTVAWGAGYLNKIGLRRSLRISVVLGALYYFIFYLIEKYSGSIEFSASFSNLLFLLITTAIVILTFNRIMWWIPLHTDMAKFTSKRNRAKQLSLQEATTLALGAIGPIVAGWILFNYSYDILFIIAILIYFISLIPFMTLPRTKEKFSWTYLQAWKEFFSRKRRGAVLAYVGDGAESVVGIIIWPIFIFELLKGNYFEVGALSSLIVAVTVGLQLIVGKYVDIGGKRKMIHISTILYAVGWLVKIFIITAFHIFIASAYHNLTKIFARTPFDALTYEKAADQGHYVDEYTVIHEIAIQLGKSLMLVFVLFLIPFFSIQWTFVLAALASLGMNFLADEGAIEKGRHSG